jgi:hypothetical protein
MKEKMGCKVSFKAVMIVAVLGLAATKESSAQTPSCTSFKNSVTAHIATVGDSASVNPDRACLNRNGKMNWTAADGETWSVDFADDAHSPFPAGQAHRAGKVRKTVGAKVRACAASDANFDAAAGGCVYKYKATHVKGGKASVIDPQVVVKPGA